MVPSQDGPDVEEGEMYPTMIGALGADRMREWHERAARDRLVSRMRRPRREAARVTAGPSRLPGLRWSGRAAGAVPARRAA
jgi:hypothetical protein